MIDLDHNATTPLHPEVADAMRACDKAGYANPASLHQAGRRARQVIEEAREAIAAMLGARTDGVASDRLIFTSGGTEANNLAILGIAAAAGRLAGRPTSGTAGATPATPSPPSHLVISAIEHPSVIGPAEHLTSLGWRLDRLGVDRQGVVCLEQLPDLLTPHTRLVSVMLGNNETGVLQPVAELAALCRRHGILVHTDAVQVVGKLPVNFRALDVAALSCSAHKFHGPRGIGALLVRHDVAIEPILFGGVQQGGLRPGTESVTLAVGMQAALALWQREHPQRCQRMAALRDRFERALRDALPNVVITGAAAARLPHTSNVAFVGLDRQALLMALDLAGVACSTGSACASGSSEPSPTLLAMGLRREVVDASLRFSLGAFTTAAEIDEAVRRIVEVCRRLAGDSSAVPAASTVRRGG